ncbi:hypothetical protein KC345_g6733 [Hortaea werneckii]|nr:hypothetical protein KC345_g6733 [Hortaea werneckii]
MARSGSRSPPPSVEIRELRGNLPLVHSPGWMLVMREMLGASSTSSTDGSGNSHRERPSDQYQWNADDLASLRQERREREVEFELAEFANLWAANQAAFEADASFAMAESDQFVDEDGITIGEMLNGRRYHDSPTGGNAHASMDAMDSDEDVEGAPETHRFSSEIPVDLSEGEIMSDSTGSEDEYISDCSTISIPDSVDSDWATTASTATTSGSDLDDTLETDDTLQTFDDLTNTVDDILGLVTPANLYTREAFLTLALMLVSHADTEFDNMQLDELVTYLQDFRDDHMGQDPIGFLAELCRALGLLN